MAATKTPKRRHPNLQMLNPPDCTKLPRLLRLAPAHLRTNKAAGAARGSGYGWSGTCLANLGIGELGIMKSWAAMGLHSPAEADTHQTGRLSIHRLPPPKLCPSSPMAAAPEANAEIPRSTSLGTSGRPGPAAPARPGAGSAPYYSFRTTE